jgi:glutamyl-tRNA reductase
VRFSCATSDIGNKNILLFRKIGRNTCEELVKHTKNEQITLINRTKGKAEKISRKLRYCKGLSELHINYKNDICNSSLALKTVDKAILNLKKPLLILDLSIPKVTNQDVEELD